MKKNRILALLLAVILVIGMVPTAFASETSTDESSELTTYEKEEGQIDPQNEEDEDDNGGNTDGNTNGNTDNNTDGNTDGNTNGNTDSNTDGNADGSADGNTDNNTDGNTDGNANGNTDGNANGNTDGSADGNTDNNTDGNTDGNTSGSTDGNAEGNTNGNTDGSTNSNTDDGATHTTCEKCGTVDGHTVDCELNTPTVCEVCQQETCVCPICEECGTKNCTEHVEESEDSQDNNYISLPQAVDFTNPAPLLKPVTGTSPFAFFSSRMLTANSVASVSTDSSSEGEIVLNKTVRYNNDNDETFTLRLEAYATGSNATVSQVPIPSDIVLVLDESGSMNDCIDCGHEMNDKCDKFEFNSTTGAVTHGHKVYSDGLDKTKTYKIVYKDGEKSYSMRTLSWCTTCNAWFSSSVHSEHKPGGGSLYSWTAFASDSDTPDYSRTDGDGYHVQFYCDCGTEHDETRMAVLKDAVTNFLDKVYTDSYGKDGIASTTADNIDNRVAIAGYGADGHIYTNNGEKQTTAADRAKNALRSAITDQSIINKGLSNVPIAGSTQTDKGMYAAKLILGQNPIPEGETRNRIVILFTDGSPGSGYVNDKPVADRAIQYAKDLKDDGVTVYTVGLFTGADASNPAQLPIYNVNANGATNAGFYANGNRFLHLVSSNYPDATSVEDGKQGTMADLSAGEGYYLSTDNEEGLYEIFGALANVVKPGSTSVTLDESAITKDIITNNFTIPDSATDVTAWVENYDGVNSWTKVDASVSKPNQNDAQLNVRVSGNTVTVTNFDFAENYVHINKDENNNTYYEGQKLVLEIVIKASDANAGGNGQITNVKDESGTVDTSGIISNGSVVDHFSQPTVDIPTDVIVKKVVVGGNADANQEFDFTYKAPTLTGYSNNNLTDGNSLTATSNTADTEKTFKLKAATTAGYKIENVLIGTDKYVYIKETVNDAYELTSVTAKSGNNDLTVTKEGDYYKVPVNTTNVEITVTNTIKSADLTIDKIADAAELEKDPNQTFLFHVKGVETDNGTKNVDMFVTVLGADEITIKGLPVGAYTVQEMTNWSWRYDVTAIAAEKDTTVTTDNTTGTIDFDLTYQGEKVSFTNNRTDPYLLDGNAYASNNFTDVATK